MKLAWGTYIRAEWVALAVGALAATGIYVSLIQPSLACLATMEEARAQRDATAKDLLDARRQNRAMVLAIAAQKRQLEKLGGSPPSLDNKESQLALIASIARGCRLDLDEYLPIGDVDTPEYSAAYLQFTARGAFPQVREFFRRVESEMDYVDITHFTLVSALNRDKPGEPGCVVTWSCKLSGMPRQPVGPEQPAPSKGTAVEVALHD